jgi:hypothetical protein
MLQQSPLTPTESDMELELIYIKQDVDSALKRFTKHLTFVSAK